METRDKVVVSADDFGLSVAVNEGIERACRDGVLTTASLMIGAPEAADAIMRARRLKSLRVGLHLVVIEGAATLPHAVIPRLTDARTNWFPSDQLALGLRYFFSPAARRQLRAEIRAQFAAFAATGLTLDHANAHKHMHLHPTVGGMLVAEGRKFGLRCVRVPSEPAMAGLPGNPILRAWTRILRRQVTNAGMHTTDHCFGLGWSGHMTEQRVAALLADLPAGTSEIYFHPASARDATLDRLMAGYEHESELACLTAPAIRDALGARAATWQSVAAG